MAGKLCADAGGDGAWPARLGAAGRGRARPTGDRAWPAGDGARPARPAEGRGGSGRTGGRPRIFFFTDPFGGVCICASPSQPAKAVLRKLQTRFAGRRDAGSARVALSNIYDTPNLCTETRETVFDSDALIL